MMRFREVRNGETFRHMGRAYVTVPNISPPTRLDIIMAPDGRQLTRCEQMGGELIHYPAGRPDALAWVCENVDY